MERPDFGGRPPNRSEGSKSTMSSIEEERLSSRSDGIRPAAAGRLLVCPPAEDPVCDAVPCIGACSAAASRDFRRLRAKLLRNHRFTSDGICPSSSSKRFVAQQSRRTAFAATHCSWGQYGWRALLLLPVVLVGFERLAPVCTFTLSGASTMPLDTAASLMKP
jgi:hypothetical protein